MQRSPGAWHPSVRIATRGSAAAVEHRRASLLAWLEKYRPQLASDGFDGETLNALGVNKDGWRAWPTIARCAGQLTYLQLPVEHPGQPLPELATLTSLRTLHCEGHVTGGFEQLLQLTALTQLTLNMKGSASPAGDAFPAPLFELTTLRTLIVRKGGRGALPGSLTRLRQLRCLMISQQVTSGWEALLPLRHLTRLEVSLSPQNVVLPPEFAHLTALRQLSISHIGRGFPHLPASLHTLRMDVVSANANGSESDYVSPAGSLPNLRHLVDLRSLDLSSFEASKGFKLLPTTLTALHIGLAPEEDVYEYTCAADVSAAVLPKALTRLANLQDLKVSGSPISEGFEYLPPTLTSLAYEEAHGRVPRALRSMIALRRLSLGMGLDNLPPNLIDMS